MADDTKNDDKVATTRNTAKAATSDDAADLKPVTLEGPGGTKVTAPARSVERLKGMGFTK